MKDYKSRVLITLLAIGILSCISKTRYDEKQKEVLEMKEKVKALEDSSDWRNFKEIKIDETFAIEQLKSHLNFYAPKCTFYDFKARKNGENVFDIRMNKRFSDGSVVGVIVRMEFLIDGTYNLINISNDPDWACN